MEQDKILEFAKSQGHDKVGTKTAWKGFDVYLLGNPFATDVPQLAMVKDDTIRMATPEETKEFFTFIVAQQRRPKASKKKAKKKK